MERLTARDSQGHAYFDNDGVLIRGANGTFHQKKDMTAHYIHDRFVALDKVIERLAAYEDTGLEPEDIDALLKREQGLAELLVNASCGCAVPYTRLAELAQAEKDGRLVVLPCKIDSAVYAITSPDNIDGIESEGTVDVFECTAESATFYSNGTAQLRLYYHGVFVVSFVTVDDFGKTVFLTREEAEAALKKREAGNEKSDSY